MRIKVVLNMKNITLPINYKHALQATVYNMLSNSKYSKFLHDEGYKKEKRSFKLFTFSRIYGQFKIENKKINYSSKSHFFITSIDDNFIEQVIEFLSLNSRVFICGKSIEIMAFDVLNDVIKTQNEYVIKAIEPIVVYSTDDSKKVIYHSPINSVFIDHLNVNLFNKYEAFFQKKLTEKVDLLEVIEMKKALVTFKNSVFVGYYITLKIKCSKELLRFILDVGLGAKNSMGFGMVDIV